MFFLNKKAKLIFQEVHRELSINHPAETENMMYIAWVMKDGKRLKFEEGKYQVTVSE